MISPEASWICRAQSPWKPSMLMSTLPGPGTLTLIGVSCGSLPEQWSSLVAPALPVGSGVASVKLTVLLKFFGLGAAFADELRATPTAATRTVQAILRFMVPPQLSRSETAVDVRPGTGLESRRHRGAAGVGAGHLDLAGDGLARCPVEVGDQRVGLAGPEAAGVDEDLLAQPGRGTAGRDLGVAALADLRDVQVEVAAGG